MAFRRGRKFFEVNNHLGNVLATLSDRKLQVADGSLSLGHYFTGDVGSAQDYYAFGMMMPGRKVQAGGYRFGFNGKEQDPETYGTGNIYDYGFRIYNPRIAKFLSEDPLAPEYPWYTPYQFAGNMPIAAIDLDGLEQEIVITSPYVRDKVTEYTKVRNYEDAVRATYNAADHETFTTAEDAAWAAQTFDVGQAAGSPAAIRNKYEERDLGLVIYSYSDEGKKMLLLSMIPERVKLSDFLTGKDQPKDNWLVDIWNSLFSGETGDNSDQEQPFGYVLHIQGVDGVDHFRNPTSNYTENLDVSTLFGMGLRWGGAKKATRFGHILDNIAKSADASSDGSSLNHTQRVEKGFTCDYEECQGLFFPNLEDTSTHTGTIRIQYDESKPRE